MSLIIGLTGGIGSGKTTVANAFIALGIDVIDADIVAREVVAKKSDALTQIRQKFGGAILLIDGNLNRAALREKIFSNKQDKLWLENLLHPKIHQALIQQLKQARSPYCLLVAPLLFENNLQRLCQRVLVIDVDEKIQISRTCQRDNVSKQQVEAILSSQISRTQRLKSADDIIINNDSKALLDEQVKKLHAKYLSLSKHS